MKKLAGIILAMVLVFSIGTTSVSAAHGRGHGKGGGHKTKASTCAFVDTNNDGICDNCPNGGTHAHNGTGGKNGHGNRCNKI